MKKIILYVVTMSYLFALLDWKIVHMTRWQKREYLEWMHAHEKQYALITGLLEGTLCMPCFALKPLFYDALLYTEAGADEQAAITHAPRPTLWGFYHLPNRQDKWTLVSWPTWLLYWLVPTLLWYQFWRHTQHATIRLVRNRNHRLYHSPQDVQTQTQVRSST